jgi:UDP-N-acetylmuramoylalanine--D-glutamate ligase
MVADIKFLLRSGAKVSFFDLRSEARLGGHLANIASGLVSYSVGKIPGDELLSAELIILSPDIPKKSLFLKKARQAGIRIEYPEILFLKMVPPITLVGVMGASGKSTVSHMLYSVLKPAFAEYDDQGLFFIDPHLPHGALTHLKKIKQGDVVLSRIPEDVMGEYHEARLSPYVAVVTSLTSAALAGMKKAFAILEFQTHNNFVVASDEVIDALKTRMELPLKAKMLRVKPDNKALVIQTAELFKVTADSIQKTLETFTGLKSHLELVKKIDGVEYYNDSASTNPVSTLFGLRKLGHGQNIVLIMGGAYTTFDYSNLLKSLPTYVRSVILLPGSGSLGIRAELEKIPDIRFFQSPTLEEAVILAKGEAKRGDVVLFSPGFEAVGVHVSRRDRGEKFVKAVRGL